MWTPDNIDEFTALYYKGCTNAELAEYFNGTKDQVKHFLKSCSFVPKRHEIRSSMFNLYKSNEERNSLPNTVEDTDNELEMRILKFINSTPTSLSIFDICEKLDLSPRTVRIAIENLKAKHYSINISEDRIQKIEPSQKDYTIFNNTLGNSPTYKFGIISDNHLCSKYERLDINESLYDIFQENDIEIVLNAGNWIEGEARFNKNDIKVHGLGNQVAYFADNYPKRDGITTVMIAGDDHEGWYYQQSGINIGAYTQMICEERGRNDIKYLSYLEGDVYFGKDQENLTKVRLMHPGGGSAYSLSYKPQKIAESISEKDKPDILIIGHYHKCAYLQHCGIHIIQAGTTKDQDLFMRKHQLSAHVGGWIVEFTQLPDGSVGKLKTEWISYDAKHWQHL